MKKSKETARKTTAPDPQPLEDFFAMRSTHIAPEDRAALREAAAKWMRGEEQELNDIACPERLTWEYRRAAKHERYVRTVRGQRFNARAEKIWL